MRYFKRAIMRFNPRTRVGCDATRRRQFSRKSWFQSTHPRGVRRSPHGGGGRGLLCFNPRTRVGCDQYGILFLEVIGCFNPRTRVGCDMGVWVAIITSIQFQSTHPRGVRHASLERVPHEALVSIHAPAWGATSATMSEMRDKVMFQSTHPRGVRPRSARFIFPVNAFQSTHPRGVRHGDRPEGCGVNCFNPRTRVGCDGHRPHIRWPPCGFQSTHPRGVRPLENARAEGAKEVSIHAPAWGATASKVGPGRLLEMFQSTHPRGVRPRGRGRERGLCRVSIHAPAWGATGPNSQRSYAMMVSIHAPAWGATVSMFYPVDSRD